MSTSPSAILSCYTKTSPCNGADDSVCLSDDESGFCSEENVQECAAYLNQEFETLGLNSIINEGQPNLVKLLNASYDLIQYNRSTAKKMEDITTSLYRTRSDLTLQSEAVSRLKSQEDTLQRSIALQKENERQLVQRNRVLSGKLKVEQEECRRLRLCMAYKEQQYSHEVKKKDREYTRLKDRLGQLVLDKSQEKKLGFKILNSLQKQRKTWNTSTSSGEDMYKLIITHYEDRQKELILENSSLRESLLNMEKELASLLNERISEYGTTHLEGESAVTSPEHNTELLGSGYYQMPFDIVREDIEQNLREKYQRLRDHISHLKEQRVKREKEEEREEVPDTPQEPQDTRIDIYQNEIEDLMSQLSDYKVIITQQEEMLVKNLEDTKENKLDLGNVLNQSHALRRIENMDKKEVRIGEREQMVMESERKLMEAAQRLDRERYDFEERKGKFYTQQFLESSVFATPSKGQPNIASFFNGLSSTPYPTSSFKSIRWSHSHVQRSSSDIGSSPYLASPLPETPHKESIVFESPLLKKDVSLSSDDGTQILNEEQKKPLQCD